MNGDRPVHVCVGVGGQSSSSGLVGVRGNEGKMNEHESYVLYAVESVNGGARRNSF
jgi:hypothetical protein